MLDSGEATMNIAALFPTRYPGMRSDHRDVVQIIRTRLVQVLINGKACDKTIDPTTKISSADVEIERRKEAVAEVLTNSGELGDEFDEKNPGRGLFKFW